jgi:hypothetical protein
MELVSTEELHEKKPETRVGSQLIIAQLCLEHASHLYISTSQTSQELDEHKSTLARLDLEMEERQR